MKSVLMMFVFTGLLIGSSHRSELTPVRIDVNHSNIGFAVSIMGGLSQVQGKFSDFKVDLKLDEKDITKSTVDVVIQAKSINTGIDARDNHLRTADFFDVEKYPEIRFRSKRLVKNGKKLTLIGDFSMHGVAREISFPFTITGRRTDAKDKLVNYGFAARLRINRKDYGINWEHDTVPGFVGDDVQINLAILTRATKIE